MPTPNPNPAEPPVAAFWPVREAALTVCALVVVIFLRRPESFLHPQFWAEDATVFFLQSDCFGARSLIMPYADYLLVWLRIVALLVSPLDAALTPAGYLTAVMLCTAGVATAFFSPRISLANKPACILAIGLVPHTGEVIGNLTNLQWITSLMLVWLLLAHEPTGRRQLVGDLLLAGAAGLTGIFSVLYLPLFLVRTCIRRTTASLLVLLVVGFTVVVQFRLLVREAGITNLGQPLTPTGILEILGLRLGLPLLLPAPWTLGWSAAVQAGAGMLAAGGLVAVTLAPGQYRPQRLLLGACVVIILTASLYRIRSGIGLEILQEIDFSDRYFYLPKLFIVWLLLQGCTWSGWRRHLCLGTLILTLTATLFSWRYYRFTDLHWATYAARIQAGEAVNGIPINPHFKLDHPGRRR